MKKILSLILFVILIFSFCFVCNTKAISKDNYISIQYNGEMKLLDDDDHTCNSTAILGDPTDENCTAFYLQMVLDIIKYAGIVLCIILTAKDFVLCITSGEKDGFRPALQKAIKRLAFACVLFFLPIIIKVIMQLIGMYNDPTAGLK